MNGNALGVVRYAEAVLKGTDAPKVVIDRAYLKGLIKLAKANPKYGAAAANARRLGRLEVQP